MFIVLMHLESLQPRIFVSEWNEEYELCIWFKIGISYIKYNTYSIETWIQVVKIPKLLGILYPQRPQRWTLEKSCKQRHFLRDASNAFLQVFKCTRYLQTNIFLANTKTHFWRLIIAKIIVQCLILEGNNNVHVFPKHVQYVS